jgi:hypothetical protein
MPFLNDIRNKANAPLAPSLAPLGGERVSVRTGEGFTKSLKMPIALEKWRKKENGAL